MPSPRQADTWVSLLRTHADQIGGKIALTYFPAGEGASTALTYAELDRRARRTAAAIQPHCQPGDRVLLLYPSGPDFVTAFFGCLYAGVVAVPAYPPRANESVHRLRAIVVDAGARLALTTRALLQTSANFTPEALGGVTLSFVTTDDLPVGGEADWRPGADAADRLAMLQYTSGSTGQPKGVMLTHANLLANQAMIRRVTGDRGRETVSAGWLPLFHDMGLIGLLMQPLYAGGATFLMPPAAFLQKPLRWLQLITRARATVSAAPNFAYDLCVWRTTAEERATLDLASWRSAMNGSEPLHADTLERFAATFAPCGFRRPALHPCYGMAEASLLITGKPADASFLTTRVDPAALATGSAQPSAAADARALVSSGQAAAGVQVAVVDPVTRRRLPDDRIGEIWVRGANIGLGYWNKPELSDEIFRARLAGRGSTAAWLRTGDLGFLRDGELFVTGRRKDVIIVRGRNLYPQDLEATVTAADPALRAHGCAAFAVTQDSSEGVVVVQEVERTALKRLDAGAVIQSIRSALAREHEVTPVAVVLVKPATVPKTSSGKIQRSACRGQFERGELDVIAAWNAGATPPPKPATAPSPATGELQAWLAGRIAALLKVPATEIDPRAPLHQLGLDSLTAVTLSGELEQHLGRPVPPTLAYDYPTLEQIARYCTQAAEPAATTPAAPAVDHGAIAIIGLGCRFPGGATNPAEFWRLLREGRDATGEIPADRWEVAELYDPSPDTPGKLYVKRGAFLGDVAGFDPDFFGIAPRDAAAMDPQHRLLLEVGWEALEDAGLAPASPERRDTGVFVGVSFDDYAQLAAHSGDLARIDAYSALGAARSLAAARLSYHLGLQGPSMLVDTLCSSSLLAVHLAVQSLRNGECRAALAGGANLMLSPGPMLASCRLKALAPDGRCKTFDASADGYARGEGAGLVVLKRLADARADGDPILAVIRGSATNHDGRSNGLTAPNGPAQEALLRRALADAGAAPRDVAFVETHGTGTILGDPIEVQALGRVYGEDRAPDAPLLLGAVKTNIGHLESAAGIAGLIKTVLALRHGELPATLHFRTPNPYIPWDRLPVKVVDRPHPLPASARLAGVSSFGMGGTNVHVLLARADESAVSAQPAARPRQLLTVSGHTAEAALAQAAALATHLETQPAASLADFCHTANTGRTPQKHRAALVAATPAEAAAALRALSAGNLAVAPATGPRIAWLFTGQGSHYAGMARELHATQPAFRATLDRCSELFRDLLPVPLTEVMLGADESRLGETLYAQPALFALEVGLGRLWLSWGLEPAGLFGHSIGEYAAACIAGVFSLEDGARLVATKARLSHQLPRTGAMVAAAAGPERLAAALAAHPGIEIAAFNGPAATTLAGPAAAIDALLGTLAAAGIGAQRLPIAQAFHSRALDPMLEEFRTVAASVAFRAPRFPLVTCRLGREAAAEVATADYWVRQMREPVQFAAGLGTLAQDLGCTVFLEIGPKPSLTSLGQAAFSRAERAAQAWLPSLRPGRSDWAVLLAALGELFTRGAVIDWTAVDAGQAVRRLGGLPTTAFQRRRCWLDLPATRPAAPARTSPPEEISTYSLHWHEAETPAPADAATGHWLLLARDPALAATLMTALGARGQSVALLDPAAPVMPAGHATRGVIVADYPEQTFALARQLVAPGLPPARLWLVTRQAIATGRELGALDLTTAPLAGFARAFALEHPAHWGGLVDLDEINPASVAAAVNDLLADGHEDLVVWRRSARLVQRLRPHAVTAGSPPAISAERTHLITGGTGGLGLTVARWLVARGARHLVLMSRRPATGAAAEAIAGLTTAGANVRTISGDVTVRDDVARVLSTIDTAMPALGSVFHAAGVAGFTPLTALTPEDFSAVLAPKTVGARHLHELSRDRALDHFVLFSSIASVWGSQGQTHYAAANAYLDTLAHERRRLGLPGLSVNWGPWDEGGMATPQARDQLRRIGLAPLPPARAVDLLGRLMANGATQVTAAQVDWSVLRPVLSLRRPKPLLEAFASAATDPERPAAKPAATSGILRRLQATDATQRDAVLGAYLQGELARVLGRPAGQAIDPAQGFFSLGMDSLMAVELRTRLEADLGITLPATIAFDRATLGDLRQELATRLFATPAVPTPARPAAPAASSEPIAIIGVACRLPGGIASPADFWSLLREGRHGAKPVPADRWPADRYYHPDPEQAGKIYAQAAGFVDGVDRFDHAFFNLYPREAAGMDPQQRLLLETAWHALEAAGLANARLRGSATGTFVGVSTSDYAQLLLKTGDPTRIDAYFGTGNALNAVAGRVAYTFGLRGPTLVTDTACSSSLVALHQACLSLRAGECTQAIAAGVNLMLTPEPAIALSRARMLAADGRCKTFDAAADGYGRGEGCGVVILKRLSAARADGDPVLAVITGSAVNQDGASSGFTVPSGSAQEELIRQALTQAGRTPDELDYIEAHGTGTPLGDPIEINALAAVVGSARRRPLLVGSVKANLGHLESAAGITGLIKTVLALHHGEIPPHLAFTRPNPHIAWDRLPVAVPARPTPWPETDNRPRVAGVSAFGFTGTNAHVIVESVPAPVPTGQAGGPLFMPLSARSPEALADLRRALLRWLEQHPDLPLADLARTYGAGRTHFSLREAYVAQDVADLRRQLAERAADPALAATPENPPPLAFLCRTDADAAAGARLLAAGLKPALVLAEPAGLLAAAELAGIFSAEEHQRLAADPAALAGLTPRPPRAGFGLASLGRVADADAASPTWWKAALAGTAPRPTASLPACRELALAEFSNRPAETLAALYVAGYALAPAAWLGQPARHLPDAPAYPFQRRRHWIDTLPATDRSADPAPAGATRPDPLVLLGERLALPGSREIRFASTYSRANGFLHHHRLFDRMVASGAQHLALIIAAGRSVLKTEGCAITSVAFLQALRLGEDESVAVQLVLAPETDAGFAATVLSAPAGQTEAEWTRHANAVLRAAQPAGETWTEAPGPEARATTGEDFHQAMAGIGYTLGPSFRWIRSVRADSRAAEAVMAADEGTIDPAGYALHPGLIDSCFQLIGWCAGVDLEEIRSGQAIYIPAQLDCVRFHRPPSTRPLRCQVRLTDPEARRTHRIRGDLRLTEEDGTPILEVLGFEARRAPRALLAPPTPAATTAEAAPFYGLIWTELPALPTPAPAPDRQWAVIGTSLVARAVRPKLDTPADLAEETDLVLFLDSAATSAPASASDAADLLALVQALAERAQPPRLYVVTRGAQALPRDHQPTGIRPAAAIGLARIAALEHPALRLKLIDLDPAAPPHEENALFHELLAGDDENQVALRGPHRFAARLAPLPPPAPVADQPARLTVGHYGNLDSLALVPAAPRPLAPDELEVDVRAVGLNFRDVLGALGLLRDHLAQLGVHRESDLPLGGECAGVVRAVGPGVTAHRPGDAVLVALAPGCMATRHRVPAALVAPLPARLTFAEAATLPVTYLTAWHALHGLARLRRGERVLIHAAAGGVGLAAIHVARLLGAEVVATASPAKWPALRALGVESIGHSRHTDYARAFAPVDVVLNSLVGDHIPASLDLLKPGGRFVEIGKLGIWTAQQVAARRPDAAYFPFDLVEMNGRDPAIIGRLLQELAPHWNSGALPPLPLTVFPLADAPAAFRFMSQARHVGKVVLTHPPAEAPRPRRDGTYLVTGGLGGIGLAVARWLAENGAGALVLCGRREPDPAQQEQLAALRASGARVDYLRADLGQPEAVAALVSATTADRPPLRGIFHAAGLLDDGLLRQQNRARLAAVYGPKADAAWALHEATLTAPLDFFVLFSSLASVLGSPGQGTYAAANAALDALAQHRQRLGRPALSINWGPWSEAGMSARLGERERARLAGLGLRSFSNAEGLAAFASLLARPDAQAAAVDLDRRALVGAFAGGRLPPLLRQLGGAEHAAQPAGEWVTRLQETPADARPALVIAALTTRLATALGLAAGETLPTDRDLTSLGFDSLTAVELQSWIAGEFHVQIPMQQIAGLSLTGLAQAILSGLHLETADAAQDPTAEAEARMAEDARLPDDLRPTGPAAPLGPPKAVLLTGATGFLGAFLLHELLTTTTATVHCLVRAADPAQARERILANLRSYHLPADIPADRLVPVPGDLAKPRFGLDAPAFADLAQRVDAIYHNGAWLNFFYTYRALHAANVGGTLEVLRLAAIGPVKPVHYVSTSGVFYSRAYRGRSLPETDAADHHAGHALGYSQSKWVAERLVAAAGERGFPVTIHRAPFITGHRETGEWNSDDFICRLVRGVIALGAMPDLEASMDIVPVDYVARAIVRLSQRPQSVGRRFHLCAPEVPWSALADWLGAAGYPVRREAYADWLARLPALRGSDHPIAPFAPLFLEKSGPDRPTVPEVFLRSVHARLDGRATAEAAAACGLDAPVIDGALWQRYLATLQAQGLLPAPSA